MGGERRGGDVVVLASGRSDRLTREVFAGLTGDEAALLASMTRRSASLAPNRALVDEGEIGIGLFLIVDGWAYRYRRGANGCRQILDFLLPGEIVGLQASLLGMMEHSAQSLTALRVTVFDPRLVADAFAGTPGLALRLARQTAAEASRTEALMTVIGCGSAMQRLAFLMASLHRRQQGRAPAEAGANSPSCPFPLRRQHLADALGLTGAHVNRTLNRFRDDGIAVAEKRRLTILDPGRLHELAGVGAEAA